MTELLLTFGANNLLLSLALALVAFGVQTLGKRPLVARLLWLLVLAKLVTPSLFAVPVVAIPGLSSATEQTLQVRGPSDATALSGRIEDDALALQEGSDLLAAASSQEPWKQALVLLWLLGSVAVLVGSLVRVLRFQRLLNLASESAPPELQRLAAEIATRLGLRKVPTICTTSAHLLPMVWWVGGPVRVLVPASLVRALDPQELRFILAHELAHVRRRDHLVRWLEWLACVLCWWNPVAWWARRSLRTNEEVCCDALVLATLKPNPRSYATSLLNVVEFLASPALRPPAMASAIHDGGFLERRLRMIISDQPFLTTPRWLQAALLLFAVALLPLGVAHAQDNEGPEATKVQAEQEAQRARQKSDMTPEAKKVWAEHQALVEAGKLTEAQAKERFADWRKSQAEHRGHEKAIDTVRLEIHKLLERVDTNKDGAITEAEAGELWPRISPTDADQDGKVTAKEMHVAWSKNARHKHDPEAFVKEVQAAVEAGRLTPAEGKDRIEAYRKKLAAEKAVQEQIAAVELRIQMAVDAGQITAEQGQARLAGYKKHLAEEQAEAELAAARERIEAAIKSGQMTAEQGKERLEAHKKHLMGEQARADVAAARKKIEAAIKSGQITPEEGRKKLEAFEKSRKKAHEEASEKR